MNKIIVNTSDFYKDNCILSFVYLDSSPLYKQIVLLSILFFLLPISAFILCAVNGILFIPGKPVGMLEDYLYLSYILLVTPCLIILLHNVMAKCRLFLEDAPSFCKTEQNSELTRIIHESISVIQKHKPIQNFTQLCLGMIAVASNTSSIFKREGGWDSIEYPMIFIIVAIHLFIILGFVLPTILMRFISLVKFQIKLTRHLVNRDFLSIKPLSPDGAGGLRSLGRLSLSYSYMLIPFIITLGVHYLTWDYLTPGFYLGLLGFLPLSFFVFFFPLNVVHKAMDETKRNIMKKLSNKYDQLNNRLLEKINEDNWENELIEKNKALEIIDKMYNVAEKMPVWPFNTAILVRFLSFNIFPLLIFVIQMLVNTDSILYNLDKLRIFGD